MLCLSFAVKSSFLSIPSGDIKKQFSTSNPPILASSYKALDLFMFYFLLLSAYLASHFVKDILKRLQVRQSTRMKVMPGKFGLIFIITCAVNLFINYNTSRIYFSRRKKENVTQASSFEDFPTAFLHQLTAWFILTSPPSSAMLIPLLSRINHASLFKIQC